MMPTLPHRIFVGDSFDFLRAQQSDVFDACVTDPPYELGFVGRSEIKELL